MLDSGAIARRLSAAYATYYATVGIEYVYLPFFFTRIGLAPGEVGVIYAGRIAALLLAQPLTTQFAERSGRPNLVLKAAMTLGFVCAAGLMLAHSFWPAALFMWVQSAFRSVAIPMLDATTLRERGSERYGRTRLWGSLGYGVGAVGFAAGVARLTYDQTGALVLPTYLVLNALMVAALYFLPRDPGVSARTDATESLVNKPIAALMALGALHWAAVETSNTYFSLFVKERGFSPSVPGYGVGVAIACETATFFVFAWFIRRGRAGTWIVASIAVSILRWLATAFAPNDVLIVAVQALHAFSFALWWGSMLKVLDDIAPTGRRGALQGVFTAVIMGLGGALGSTISGRLLGHFGGQLMYCGAAVFDVIALALALATMNYWNRARAPALAH